MENKTLVIIILIVLAILVIGFAFFQSFRGTTDTPTNEESDPEELVYPTISPEQVVQEFYDWYLTEGNALPNENFATSSSLTARFINSVQAQIATEEEFDRDPFVCSAELPLEVSTNSTNINDRRANVVVDSVLSEVEMISFIAELDLTEDASAWQINNVVCFVKGI
ncbi:hypothetical protein CL654_01315 [bacterium]|nr:hypothetical protein [bacterium]|tara:strand:- start:8420 stop:8920 length:501 start_codon:yes stop_codon:yes gene_type:complete